MSEPNKICLLTGSTGFLGSVVSRHLKQNGWQVRELRRLRPGEKAGEQVLSYRVGDEPSVEVFHGVAALIHLAYDFKAFGWADIERINVQGSNRLLEAARRNGVKNIIFVSSVSAYEGCVSLYGRAKLAIEKAAAGVGAVVIRPGLIYARPAGGLFKNLMNLIQKFSLVPLVGLGRQ